MASGVLFTLAARNAATHTGSDVVELHGAAGVKCYVAVTAVSSTGTVQVQLQSYDSVSDTWANVLGATMSAASTTAGTRTFTVHPAVTTSTTLETVSACPGDRIRAVATVANSTVTFSVGAERLEA